MNAKKRTSVQKANIVEITLVLIDVKVGTCKLSRCYLKSVYPQYSTHR